VHSYGSAEGPLKGPCEDVVDDDDDDDNYNNNRRICR
jgi:hypothetical protein